MSVAWMALGGFHGANMKFLWVMLTLSLGRGGGHSWELIPKGLSMRTQGAGKPQHGGEIPPHHGEVWMFHDSG